MKEIDEHLYIAKKLGHSLLGIFVVLGKATAVEEVSFSGHALYNEYGTEEIGSWGSRIRSVDGGMLLSDGRVVLCITSKEGSSTFSSGELETNYFILAPRTDEDVKRALEYRKKRGY